MLLFFTAAYPQSRVSLGASLAPCNFLGDLGGGAGVRKPFFFDTNIKSTRLSGSVFLGIQLSPVFTWKNSVSVLKVSGDDHLTRDITSGRYVRNLNFQSLIYEFYTAIEFNFLKAFARKKDFAIQPYFVVGAGMFHFNPYTYYRGTKVYLQPVGTEGQGLPGYAKNYSLYALCVPVGAGFRFHISPHLSMCFELINRYTNTDFIDDVSGQYPDAKTIVANKAPGAANITIQLSDRRSELDPNKTPLSLPGAYRGNPKQKDTYINIAALSFYYNIGRFENKNYLIKRNGKHRRGCYGF